MLTEKDKYTYKRLSENRKINRSFYSLGKWLFVKPLRHIFVDLKIEGLDNLKKVDGPSIIVPYHCLSIEEPLLGEFLDDYVKKIHALIDVKVFSRHRAIYGLLEEVPFNTSCKESFEKDYLWSMREAKSLLESGESLLVFNDGDTAGHIKIMNEKNLGILPLSERPNSSIPAKLAFETGTPVIPVAPYASIKHERDFYSWDNWKSWFNLVAGAKIPYTLEFLEPMYPQDFKNRGEMRKEIRKRQLESYVKKR